MKCFNDSPCQNSDFIINSTEWQQPEEIQLQINFSTFS